MSLKKWIMKNGSVGGSMKIIVREYIKLKKEEPNSSRLELNIAISAWWFNSVSNKQLSKKEIKNLRKSKSLKVLVKNILIIDKGSSLYSSQAIADTFLEVISEIVNDGFEKWGGRDGI